MVVAVPLSVTIENTSCNFPSPWIGELKSGIGQFSSAHAPKRISYHCAR
jgi:hypothetical protein